MQKNEVAEWLPHFFVIMKRGLHCFDAFLVSFVSENVIDVS